MSKNIVAVCSNGIDYRHRVLASSAGGGISFRSQYSALIRRATALWIVEYVGVFEVKAFTVLC